MARPPNSSTANPRKASIMVSDLLETTQGPSWLLFAVPWKNMPLQCFAIYALTCCPAEVKHSHSSEPGSLQTCYWNVDSAVQSENGFHAQPKCRYNSWLAAVLGVTGLSWTEWRMIIILSVPVVLIDELLKSVSRLLERHGSFIQLWASIVPRRLGKYALLTREVAHQHACRSR
jgi:hypothetical protein